MCQPLATLAGGTLHVVAFQASLFRLLDFGLTTEVEETEECLSNRNSSQGGVCKYLKQHANKGLTTDDPCWIMSALDWRRCRCGPDPGDTTLPRQEVYAGRVTENAGGQQAARHGHVRRPYGSRLVSVPSMPDALSAT